LKQEVEDCFCWLPYGAAWKFSEKGIEQHRYGETGCSSSPYQAQSLHRANSRAIVIALKGRPQQPFNAEKPMALVSLMVLRAELYFLRKRNA
jgi:hypothetical protein